MIIEDLTIRKIKDSDYDNCMKLLRSFTQESIFTNQYPGQPDKDKKKSCQMYNDKYRCFLGSFIGTELVGICDFCVKLPDHPWSDKNYEFGLCLLEPYYTQSNIAKLMMTKLEDEAKQKGMH